MGSDADSHFEAKRQEIFRKYLNLVYPVLLPAIEKDSAAKFEQLCNGWVNYIGLNNFIFPDILITIICKNAVRCAKVVLQGDNLLHRRRADPNGRHPCGFCPLHMAAETFSVDIVKLLLRHGASANLRTEGDRVIEGLLPLHIAVENASMHKFLEDNWEDGCSVTNLITLLCLPAMKMFLDTTRLIAKHTDNIIDEVWNYVNDGKLVQLAILLLAAQKQLRGPANRTRSKVSLNGFDIIERRTLEAIRNLYCQQTAMVSEGKNGSALKKLKSKKEALIAAVTLVGIVHKAGEDLERYIQTHPELPVKVPHEEILEHVSSILNNNGIVPSGKNIDSNNLQWYKRVGATPIHKSESQGSKKILLKVPLKGLDLNLVRNKFFPYWKSVLSARLNVNRVPSCELSMKDRKRMQGAKGSRTNIQVGNKSKGIATLMSQPHLGSQFECRRQLCTVALTSLKLLKRA